MNMHRLQVLGACNLWN